MKFHSFVGLLKLGLEFPAIAKSSIPYCILHFAVSGFLVVQELTQTVFLRLVQVPYYTRAHHLSRLSLRWLELSFVSPSYDLLLYAVSLYLADGYRVSHGNAE